MPLDIRFILKDMLDYESMPLKRTVYTIIPLLAIMFIFIVHHYSIQIKY